MTESWLGRILELEVGPVAHGGHCVSRVDGRVLFVRHALPGERVRAEVTEDKGGSFCRADAIEVLSGSEHRVTPPCPLAAPGGCGGCDWQHAEPAYQRELKAAVVAEQLQRLAGITRDVVVEPLEGGPLGWRSRVRLVAGRDGRAGLRAHHSHRVIPIDDCPIAVPGSLGTALSKRWRPGTELEVASDGENHLHLRELATVRGRTQGKQLSGGMAIQHAAGRDWRLDAHGFWQVHPRAADTLAELVREWADAPRGGVAWDLYAGVGLFASVLADQVGPDGQVLAIESEPARGLRRRAQPRRPAAGQLAFRTRGTPHRRRPGAGRRRGPRPAAQGVSRAVVNAIAAGEPDRIVYVACDPAALARDVQFFSEHGYSLTDLRAFDAFPMTHHVECVALLQ